MHIRDFHHLAEALDSWFIGQRPEIGCGIKARRRQQQVGGWIPRCNNARSEESEATVHAHQGVTRQLGLLWLGGFGGCRGNTHSSTTHSSEMGCAVGDCVACLLCLVQPTPISVQCFPSSHRIFYGKPTPGSLSVQLWQRTNPLRDPQGAAEPRQTLQISGSRVES